MTTFDDRVVSPRAVLEHWRAELEPLVDAWSLLLHAPTLEVAHREQRPYAGAGIAGTFLTLQAAELVAAGRLDWHSPITAGAAPASLTDLCRDVTRLHRAGDGSADAPAARLVSALGGAVAVNDRLRRAGFATRVRDDGASVVLPVEHAEVLAALTGNPAYAEALALGHDSGPFGLAAYVRTEVPLVHRLAAGERVRHGGGRMLLSDGSEVAVHCFTEGPSPALEMRDPVFAAMARAMARTLRMLGHAETTTLS